MQLDDVPDYVVACISQGNAAMLFKCGMMH